MKTITALLFLALSLAAFAAEPTIRVNDLGNVYQVNADGSEINLGAPYDAITNNPALGAKIQQAAQVRLAAFKAEQTAALNAAVAAKEAEKTAALAAKEAELVAARARIAQLETAMRAANVPVPAAP